MESVRAESVNQFVINSCRDIASKMSFSAGITFQKSAKIMSGISFKFILMLCNLEQITHGISNREWRDSEHVFLVIMVTHPICITFHALARQQKKFKDSSL